jgi:hypothetical protein
MCTFQTDEIDCEFMNENMIVQAWHKDCLVDLGAASGFETESLPVRSEGMALCVCIE